MATARVFRGREVEEIDDPTRWAPSRGWLRAKDELVWIDVESVQDQLDALCAATGLERSVLLHPAPSGPSVTDEGGFIDLTLVAPSGDDRMLAQMRCLVGERWVVTAHAHEVEALTDLAEQAARGAGAIGELEGPDLVAMLVEWMLASYVGAFDGIEQDLERVDVESMESSEAAHDDQLARLVALRQEVGELRRALVQHRIVLSALAHSELVGLGDEATAERFGRLRADYRDAVDAARDARESVFNSFDVLIARTEQRTNEIVKVLTILSFLLLPGSFVAAVLGMNFEVVVFDWPWLFWGVIGLFTVFVTVTITVARRRRWL
ncbi:MAG: CorA family divalent cation transporter [Gaiella sp.]